MSSKQFEIDIAFGVLIRVRYTATKGKVDHFVAQLELYDDTGQTPSGCRSCATTARTEKRISTTSHRKA